MSDKLMSWRYVKEQNDAGGGFLEVYKNGVLLSECYVASHETNEIAVKRALLELEDFDTCFACQQYESDTREAMAWLALQFCVRL